MSPVRWPLERALFALYVVAGDCPMSLLLRRLGLRCDREATR